jgi:8-oxo-dGTP diphosphatase
MKTVAKTLLFDKDNKILILYRGHTHPRYAHHPDFPGGEVEAGESSVVAVSREIKEETDLVVDARLINEVYIEVVDDQLTHIICETRLETSRPTINLSWEHEDFEWLTLEELRGKDQPIAADDYYLNVLEYISSRLE